MEEKKEDGPTSPSCEDKMPSGFWAVVRKKVLFKKMNRHSWDTEGPLNTQSGLKISLRVWGSAWEEQNAGESNEIVFFCQQLSSHF